MAENIRTFCALMRTLFTDPHIGYIFAAYGTFFIISALLIMAIVRRNRFLQKNIAQQQP